MIDANYSDVIVCRWNFILPHLLQEQLVMMPHCQLVMLQVWGEFTVVCWFVVCCFDS